MDFQDEEYLLEMKKDFFEETEEMLHLIEANILQLENQPEDKEAINEIFRAAHTIKGGSATVGFNDVQSFTHAMEDALSSIREGKVTVQSSTVDTLLKCLDILTDLVDCAREEEAFQGDLEKSVALANSLVGGTDVEEKAKVSTASQTESEPKAKKSKAMLSISFNQLNVMEASQVQEALSNDNIIYQVTTIFDSKAEMASVGPIQAFANLQDLGSVIKTEPSIEALQTDDVFEQVDFLLSSEAPADKIVKDILSSDLVQDAQIKVLEEEDIKKLADWGSLQTDEPAKSEESSEEEDLSEEASSSVEVSEGKDPQTPEAASDEKRRKKQSNILRVDSERIDKMLNLVGELTVNKSGYAPLDASMQYSVLNIASSFENIKNKLINAQLDENRDSEALKKEIANVGSNINNLKEVTNLLKTSWQELERITNDLRGHVMKIRMVTVGQIFNRVPRIVRDLSRERGKSIEVNISGEDTEMDKSVVEELLDPIIHIIRNSIDHGIEAPEERKKAGKEEQGTLSLSASHEGNVIILKIKDDGKGIDPNIVLSKAIEKGIVNRSDNLSEKDKVLLIFEPGFSTAAEVSAISGRGVGMDVVKRRIESLNGTVSVETEPGKGTELTLKLPLTLTIMQALLVQVHTEIYSIPITSILETQRIEEGDIQKIENREVLTIRGEIVSVIHVNKVFDLPKGKPEDQYAVIVNQEDKKIAVIVDNLIGEQDIVIKALKNRLINVQGIAGAANLGDGTITFILDINSFIEAALTAERTGSKNKLVI